MKRVNQVMQRIEILTPSAFLQFNLIIFVLEFQLNQNVPAKIH